MLKSIRKFSTIYAIGENSNYQLGLGHNKIKKEEFWEFDRVKDVKMISAGVGHCACVTSI